MGKSQNRHAERERSDISLYTVWSCSNDVSEKAKLRWQKADWWLPQNIVSWLWWWFYGCLQPLKLIRLFTLHGRSLFSMNYTPRKLIKSYEAGKVHWAGNSCLLLENKNHYILGEKPMSIFPLLWLCLLEENKNTDIKPVHKDISYVIKDSK